VLSAEEYSHEEGAALSVVELRSFENVTPVFKEASRYGRHQTRAIPARNSQYEFHRVNRRPCRFWER